MIGVVVDLGQGRASVGEIVVDVATAPAGPPGALVVGSLVLRPLRFGERVRLVDHCCDLSPAAFAASVLAVVTDGAAAGPAVEAIALHLAGARLEEATETTGFAAAAAAVTRTYGWSPQQLADADADLVDKLAADLMPAGSGTDGWESFTFDAAALTAVQVRDELALDLLRRGAAVSSTSGGAQAGARSRAAGSSGGFTGAPSSPEFDGPGPHRRANSEELIGLPIRPVSEPATAQWTATESRLESATFDDAVTAPATPADPVATPTGSPGADWPEAGRPGVYWPDAGRLDAADPAVPVPAADRGLLRAGAGWDSEPGAVRAPLTGSNPITHPRNMIRPVDGVALIEDVGEHLAMLLDDEADLRGVRR